MSFTPHDPIEDTETSLEVLLTTCMMSFTPHDPIEDTETGPRRGTDDRPLATFTPHDPIEDTETTT